MLSGRKWPNYALIFAGSLVLLGFSCQARVPRTLDQLFADIERRFVSGELASAEAEAKYSAVFIGRGTPEQAARFRLQQAKVRLYQGRTKQALALLAEPLGTMADKRGESDRQATERLFVERDTLLAIAYAKLSDLGRARIAIAEAESLSPDQISGPAVAIAHGLLAMEDGSLDEAERYFELSLTAATEIGDRFQRAQALINLGVISMREEHFEDALLRFEQASDVARSIGARHDLENLMGNVGWVSYKLGDYKKALVSSEAAQQEAAAIGATSDQVAWLHDAGLDYFRLGNLARAATAYKESLALARSITDGEEAADALVSLGQLSLRKGDAAAALEYAREAQAEVQVRADESGTFQPVLLQARALKAQGRTSEARAHLLGLLGRVFRRPSVLWEVQEQLAEIEVAAGNGGLADVWFKRAIETFERQRSGLGTVESKLPFLENGTELYLGYMEQLIREGRTDDALAVLDQSRAATLADGLGLSRVGRSPGTGFHARELAKQLGGTILVYCLRPQRSYLWAVGAAGTKFFLLPDRERVLTLVQAYTDGIVHGRDVLGEGGQAGEALYDALLRPAASLLPGGGGRVFLVGDDALHSLNFETIVVPASALSGSKPHFWIEDATISNAASLSLLSAGRPGGVRASERVKGGANLLLIGDPIHGPGREDSLPEAAHEVSAVAGHFSPEHRLVLTGADASPGAYAASGPGRFSLIHFVAHGAASELNPLRSSVTLSPTGGRPDLYKLYARDILDERIGADLVTISACYGSGSRFYSGEGLVGLAWAFLRAGSHNVIASQWEVSDASTPELMGELYGDLVSGMRPDAALRAAKLRMLHTEGVFRKPLYWAPFQLYSGA